MDISKKYVEDRKKDLKRPIERYEDDFKIVSDFLEFSYPDNKEIFEKVFEVGTGDFGFQKVLKNKGINSSGCDYDNCNLESDKLPIEDGSISLLVALSVIEHLKDPGNFLAEAKRVLKKGGILLMVVPNFKYNYSHFYDDPTHVRPYTSLGIKALLKLTGFNNAIALPWVKNSRKYLWKLGNFGFKICNLVPFRGDTKLPVPNIIRINTEIMIVSCQK